MHAVLNHGHTSLVSEIDCLCLEDRKGKKDGGKNRLQINPRADAVFSLSINFFFAHR